MKPISWGWKAASASRSMAGRVAAFRRVSSSATMSAKPRIGTRIAATTGAFGAVARNPALRRVQLAFLGFNLTEWGIWVAILVFAYERGGASEVALVAVLQLAPAAVVAPLAASFGDRFPRERVLLAAYLLQAAAAAAIAATLLADAPV